MTQYTKKRVVLCPALPTCKYETKIVTQLQMSMMVVPGVSRNTSELPQRRPPLQHMNGLREREGSRRRDIPLRETVLLRDKEIMGNLWEVVTTDSYIPQTLPPEVTPSRTGVRQRVEMLQGTRSRRPLIGGRTLYLHLSHHLPTRQTSLTNQSHSATPISVGQASIDVTRGCQCKRRFAPRSGTSPASTQHS